MKYKLAIDLSCDKWECNVALLDSPFFDNKKDAEKWYRDLGFYDDLKKEKGISVIINIMTYDDKGCLSNTEEL